MCVGGGVLAVNKTPVAIKANARRHESDPCRSSNIKHRGFAIHSKGVFSQKTTTISFFFPVVVCVYACVEESSK